MGEFISKNVYRDNAGLFYEVKSEGVRKIAQDLDEAVSQSGGTEHHDTLIECWDKIMGEPLKGNIIGDPDE